MQEAFCPPDLAYDQLGWHSMTNSWPPLLYTWMCEFRVPSSFFVRDFINLIPRFEFTRMWQFYSYVTILQILSTSNLTFHTIPSSLLWKIFRCRCLRIATFLPFIIADEAYLCIYALLQWVLRRFWVLSKTLLTKQH